MTKRSSPQLRIRPGNEMHRLRTRRPRRPSLSCPDASCSLQYRAGALFPTWTPPRVLADSSSWVGRLHAIGASLPFRRSLCLEVAALARVTEAFPSQFPYPSASVRLRLADLIGPRQALA